jgi:hypothetical protein
MVGSLVRAVEFAGAMRAAAERAGERAGWEDHHLEVAGEPIRLRFAGGGLVDAILPALAHLAAPPRPAGALTVLLWDTASTGVPRPEAPWSREEVGVLGQVNGYNYARVRTVVAPVYGGLTLFDSERRTVVFWARDAAEVTWSERANPLRVALHWALDGPGRQLVHAGAVGRGSTGLLVGGPGGTGKSTTATACVAADWDYAGDDHVLLTVDGDGARAHALYGTAKLSPATAARVPGLSSAIVNYDALGGIAAGRPLHPDEKLVADLHRHRPERLRSWLPVSAVVLPRIAAGPRSALRRARQAEALRALAPSTVMQLPHAGGRPGLGPLAEALRGAPSYVLELGRDVDAVPELLGELLEELDT